MDVPFCKYCKEKNEDFENDEAMDMHYFKDCKYLTECKYCE